MLKQKMSAPAQGEALLEFATSFEFTAAPSDPVEVYFNQSGGITIQHGGVDDYDPLVHLLLNAPTARQVGRALIAMANKLEGVDYCDCPACKPEQGQQ